MTPFLPTGETSGGVSSIRTVGSGDPHTSKCDIPDTPSTNSLFTLDPTVPAQCAGQNVSWNVTRYHEPPNIRGFIPGVGAFRFNRPTLQNATRLAWEVNHREGTQFFLLFRPEGSTKDRDAITSPLITVTGKGDESIDANSRWVIGALTSPTATPTAVTSPTATPTVVILPPDAAGRPKKVK